MRLAGLWRCSKGRPIFSWTPAAEIVARTLRKSSIGPGTHYMSRPVTEQACVVEYCRESI